MTETTTVPSTGSNGAATARTIDVENPSTGKVIASVPVVPPEQVPELVARARTAQAGWEALGFDGRTAVTSRASKVCGLVSSLVTTRAVTAAIRSAASGLV